MNSFNFNLSEILSFWEPVKTLIYNLFINTKIYGVSLIYILLCLFILTNCIYMVLHLKVKGSDMIPRGDNGRKEKERPKYDNKGGSNA